MRTERAEHVRPTVNVWMTATEGSSGEVAQNGQQSRADLEGRGAMAALQHCAACDESFLLSWGSFVVTSGPSVVAQGRPGVQAWAS